jgi:pimeloyl-ACP methyl ester carboxylesterase
MSKRFLSTPFVHNLTLFLSLTNVFLIIFFFFATLQVDLLGHSYGGYISMLTADRYPNLIRRLILICPAGLAFNWIFQGIQLGEPQSRFARLLLRFSRTRLGWLANVTTLPFVYAPNSINNLMGVESFRDYVAKPRDSPSPVPTLLIWGCKDLLLVPRMQEDGSLPGLGAYFSNNGENLHVFTMRDRIWSWLDKQF